MKLTKTTALRPIIVAVMLILMLPALVGCEEHTEHVWVENAQSSVAATCTESGTTSYYCSECDEIKSETVPATGHDMQITELIDATCDTDGVKNYKCTKCEKNETETVSHTGHDMAPANRIEPTCESDGSQNYKCTKCEKAQAETLPATGHNMKLLSTVDATCETDGTKTYKCVHCEKTVTETVTASGHNMQHISTVDATCVTDGAKIYKCEYCEKTDSMRLPAPGHSYQTRYIAPTYTANGRYYSECTVCSNTALIHELVMLDKNFIENNINIFTANAQTNIDHLLSEAQLKKIYGCNGNKHGLDLRHAMALAGIDKNGKITVLTPEYGKPALALPAGATYYLKLSSFEAFSAEFTFTPDPKVMAAAGVKTTKDQNGDVTYDISEYDTLTLTMYVPKEMTVLFRKGYTYMILVDCGQNNSGWSYFAKEHNAALSKDAYGERTLTIQLSDMKQYKNASLTTFKNISLRFTGWSNGPDSDGVPVDGYDFYVGSISLGKKDFVEISKPSAGYEKCPHTLEDGSSAFERITVAPTCRSAGYDAEKCALCQKVNVIDDYTAYKPILGHDYRLEESADKTKLIRRCTTCDYREERVYGDDDIEDRMEYGFYMLPQLDYYGNEYKNTTSHTIFDMKLTLREAGLTRREDSDGFAYYDYHRYGSSHSYMEIKPSANYFPNHFVFEVILRLGEPDANGYYPSGTFQLIERGSTDTFLTFATLNAEGKFTFPNCDIEIALTQEEFTAVSIALHTDINKYDIYKDGVLIAEGVTISETVDTARFNISEMRFMQFSKNSNYGIGAGIHIGGIYIYHGGLPMIVEGIAVPIPPSAKDEE